MKIKTEHELREIAVKAEGKFAVYVANNTDFDSESDGQVFDFIYEQVKAKYQDVTVQSNIIFYVQINGLFLFDTEQEAREFYSIFVQKPVYSSGLYAELISPVDGILDENT